MQPYDNIDRKCVVSKNMKAYGFSFQKNRIRIVELAKINDAIEFREKKIVDIDSALPLPELSDRYVKHFREHLNGSKPDLVAVRRVWESSDISTSICQIMPVALLALTCHELQLAFVDFTPGSLKSAGSFGLAKGLNPLSCVDDTFGAHPPYWDDIHRGALLAAWRALLKAK